MVVLVEKSFSLFVKTSFKELLFSVRTRDTRSRTNIGRDRTTRLYNALFFCAQYDRHINSKQASGSKINAIYSTPSCYLKSVNDRRITFPTKQDDFFPYKSDKHSYWTGYFTSRPTQKYFERRGNNYLQVRRAFTLNCYIFRDICFTRRRASVFRLLTIRTSFKSRPGGQIYSFSVLQHDSADYSLNR